VSHEYTKKITCPYCDHEFSDSWEYNDNDGDEIECVSCERSFTLQVHFDVQYSTERLTCEGAHEWGSDIIRHDYDAETCARYNAKRFAGRTDHEPHTMYVRLCRNCDQSDFVTVGLSEPCPWEAS